MARSICLRMARNCWWAGTRGIGSHSAMPNARARLTSASSEESHRLLGSHSERAMQCRFCWMGTNKGAIQPLLSFENRSHGFTEGELMDDSMLVIVIGLMTALVTLSVGLMRDSRLILAIGLVTVLASLAGCAGRQMRGSTRPRRHRRIGVWD